MCHPHGPVLSSHTRRSYKQIPVQLWQKLAARQLVWTGDALLLAWKKHLLTWLITDSWEKTHRNSSFTSKEGLSWQKNRTKTQTQGETAIRSDYLSISKDQPCVPSHCCKAIVPHMERACQQLYKQQSTERFRGFFLLESPAQTLLPAWAYQLSLK